MTKGSVAVLNRSFTHETVSSPSTEGFLVPRGFRLQGFPADVGGELKTGLGDLQVGAVVAPPKESTSVVMNVNLDAQAEIETDAFDPLNPEATASFSTSVTIYDSLGNAHQTMCTSSKPERGNLSTTFLPIPGKSMVEPPVRKPKS